LVATAGSDAHGPKGYLGGVGNNVVYAEELSTKGILRALAQGHLYLSAGPTLTVQAQNGAGATAMMGDTLPMQGDAITVTTQWGKAPADATLRLIVNGAVQERLTVGDSGEARWTLPAYGPRWCAIELRGANGAMAAVTNPLFFVD
jgi:hypothetical protein